MKQKILFVSAEVAPLARTGGLGDVVAALPPVLQKQGCDVRIIMPLYKMIQEQYGRQMELLGWHMVRMGWRTLYCGVLKLVLDDQVFYFIDNEYYFNHDKIYLEYSFDIERFSFFQRAVLASLEKPLDFMPDILHLNDWQTGMIPSLLGAHYRPYGRLLQLRTLFTIHNLKYQGIHGKERIADLMDLPDEFMTETGILKDGVPNFMKVGIVYADWLTTVSPSYAEEIKLDYYGEGLSDLLRRQSHKLSGLLNGIDTQEYDPATDKALASNYTVANWQEGKAACKAALQNELGLVQSAKPTLMVMVSRLVEQKGLDLLLHILPELLDDELQLAILGTGTEEYEKALQEVAERHPGRMSLQLTFDESMARRFYAAADIFLMPSLFEPCGLSQMISMRYGSLPVVRETGGLKDTVKPFNQYAGTGNGFSFRNINAHELLFVSRYACDVRRHMPQAWQALVREALAADHSWTRSARDYAALYEQLLTERAAQA